MDIYAIGCVLATARPSVFHCKNFNVGYYAQTMLPVYFPYLPCFGAPLTTNISYRLVTLTVAGRHKVSLKQNPLASCSPTFLNRPEI